MTLICKDFTYGIESKSVESYNMRSACSIVPPFGKIKYSWERLNREIYALLSYLHQRHLWKTEGEIMNDIDVDEVLSMLKAK